MSLFLQPFNIAAFVLGQNFRDNIVRAKLARDGCSRRRLSPVSITIRIFSSCSYFTSLAVCTLPLVEFPQAIQVSLPVCKSRG